MSVKCPECNFEAKTNQGLASHRMIRHNVMPKIAQQEAKLSAEAVSTVVDDLCDKLAEQSRATNEALGEMSKRIDELPSEVVEPLIERLSQAYQSSSDDRVDSITGRHSRLMSLWNAAEGCESCSHDKAEIIAEITTKAREGWVEKSQLAEVGSDEGQPALEVMAGISSEVADEPSEADPQTVYKVVGEQFLAELFYNRQREALKGIPEVGEETPDEALADLWSNAGFEVEAVNAIPAPAPTTEKGPEEGILDRIRAGKSLFGSE